MLNAQVLRVSNFREIVIKDNLALVEKMKRWYRCLRRDDLSFRTIFGTANNLTLMHSDEQLSGAGYEIWND